MAQPNLVATGNPASPYALVSRRTNVYVVVLLVLSIAVMLTGVGFLIYARAEASSSSGVDIITSNLEYPFLLLHSFVGWAILALGFVTFCLWLAVQGIRHG